MLRKDERLINYGMEEVCVGYMYIPICHHTEVAKEMRPQTITTLLYQCHYESNPI